MGFAFSLFLIAIGAVLTWGVTAEIEGLDITAIGVVLMVVGGLGLILSALFYAALLPFGPEPPGSRRHDADDF